MDIESLSDFKMFRTANESEADLLVYLTDSESLATGDALWYYMDSESLADKKIFWVEYESAADVKIHFVDSEGLAGWRNSHPLEGRIG